MANKPKPPKELKDLASFLEARGYTLAIPFDNIRKPGYIGTYNPAGQEIIWDNGTCLKDFVTVQTGGTVLGNYKKASKFSLKVFVKFIGDIFGLDLDFLKVKNVSLSFPGNIIKTDFITVKDIEDDWQKISPTCTKKIADPSNFLILQALETNSIKYSYELKKKLTVDAKADLEKIVAAGAAKGKYGATVGYESDTSFSIEVTDIPLTVGYKTAAFTIQPA